MSIASPKSHASAATRRQPFPIDELSRLRRAFGWEIKGVAQNIGGVWHTENSAEIHFPDDVHDDLYAIEDGSFWFRHRNRTIENALRRVGSPSALWEIGAGNGCVAHHLQRCGMRVATVEPMAAGAINSARRGIEVSVCGRFESLNLPDDSLPAAGCFDVLEHLEHPEILVQEVRRTLQPSGIFIATVPAMNWLWSDADVVSGHFRRYTRSSLREMVAAQGFESLRTEYFMMSLAAPMFCLRTLPSLLRKNVDSEASLATARRQIADTSSSSQWSPAKVVLRCEAALARIVPLPFGTSVLGVFRKPGAMSANAASRGD